MNDVNLSLLQEIQQKLISILRIEKGLSDGSLVILKGRKKPVVIGNGVLIKVNASIGCSKHQDYDGELEKLKLLSKVNYQPDLMMDLSIVKTERPLYHDMIDIFTGPVGTLPHYLHYSPEKGIEPTKLMDEIELQAEVGVSWMTFHLTPQRDLYELAQKTRLVPITSRGGGLVIKDMYINNRSENLFMKLFPDILQIMKKNKVGLSLGTTFRPANIAEAMDEVHINEICLQGKFISEARKQGVPVILEAVGHMPINKYARFVDIIINDLNYNLPLMTLGPIPTDAATGEDHIANAIGATHLAMLCGTHVINSITREEHTGQLPGISSIIEGLKTARVAAHSVNIAKFPINALSIDKAISEKRADNYTCVAGYELFTHPDIIDLRAGCSRCGDECPLVINFKLS